MSIFNVKVEEFVMPDDISDEDEFKDDQSKGGDSDFVLEKEEEEDSASDWEASLKGSQRSKVMSKSFSSLFFIFLEKRI